MTADGDQIELLGVGDIVLDRSDPDSVFDLVRSRFRAGDIVFGNCESPYSDRPGPRPDGRPTGFCGAPKSIDALANAGFHAMSFANNHHMDAGVDACFDTLRSLHDAGIRTCGTGENLGEARKPAVIEVAGTTVAFFGCSSILFSGYIAEESTPGCTPLRVATTYEAPGFEHEQPGAPPYISTVANAEDVDLLCHDIRAAKDEADVVVFSPHWGLHYTPVKIAQYEEEVGRRVIDAGADLILGHHAHVLKPINTYKNKVLFHSLGNFAVDLPFRLLRNNPEAYRLMLRSYGEFTIGDYPDYPTFSFHPNARMTVIAKAVIRNRQIERVSYLPCLINREGQPEPLASSDQRFFDVDHYVRDITTKAGYATQFEVDGDEVVVSTQ